MADAYEFISSFQDAGVFDIVLPFLLVFAIVFAILEKSKVFGTDADKNPKTNINAIVLILILPIHK